MRQVLGRVGLAVTVAVAASLLAGCASKSAKDAASPTTSPASTDTTGKPESIRGKAHAAGTITVMYAAAAAIDPLPTPFTITVPDAGRGGLDLPRAVVNGKTNAIVWTGGRPLPVTGSCKLDAGPVNVQVDAGGARISLDGSVRALTAGQCMFGSSVAVGSNGISSPAASVSFTLPHDADFTTSGGATVVVPAARRYEGRSGNLGLVGRLVVTTVNDEIRAASVAVETGTWVVTITATADPTLLRVVADLEGSLLVNRA